LEIPGVPGGRAEVLSVSPNDGAVVIRLRGVSKNPKDEIRPATRESLSVDVTRKPLISLVWAGFYVMMAGALLALVRRSREASRASASSSVSLQPEPEDSGKARGTVGAPPGAIPVPIQTRSTTYS
jgi:hypothetical protein